ncbi:unnamed protein product [Urochloa decumbens]|uniref:Uncharacterized protein n=1 Tax=Urochloa decumbens TaxID=240449 RepID=A0ABC9A971_9POAL
MPPGPGRPGVADKTAPATPRSPHRGNGAAVTPQSPLRIRQDGKFYERLLTKESSAAAGNLSFRYYWAEPGAVPFVWESQPGTPKDVARMAAAAGGALPAITPPPSYLLRHGGNGRHQQAARHDQRMSGGRAAARGGGGKKQRRRCGLKRIRIGFIAGFFRRLSLGKAASWRRPAPVVKVASSSSRWLFSSVAIATEAGGEHNLHHHHHDGEIAAAVAAARTTKQPQHKAAPCSSPAPWLLRFRSCSSGGRGGGGTGGCA